MALLLLWPLLELVVLIFVGDAIGALPTLGLLLLSALIGMALLRGRGLVRVATALAEGPSRAAFSRATGGFADIAAGLLFLIPGFLSDLAAVALLLPPVQRWLAKTLVPRNAGQGVPDVLEGTFVRVDDGWRDGPAVLAPAAPEDRPKTERFPEP
ncbi:FxsA family protein [Roseiterribacter gracilis]|uniref:FxsA family protein n=1 Tax=Roseiterribacter gracilis TaxID=2812848 RepID=UPI003B430DDA